MDESVNGLEAGHAGACEDSGDDGQSGAPLRQLRAQSESDPEWDSRQSIPEVVDQVGQQRDAAAEGEHDGLSDCRHPRERQARARRL